MSLAGIQNPFFLPAVYSPASDVTVTAGTPVILATTTTAVIDLVHGFVLIGVESQSAWYPTGSIIELWGSATTQNVTVKQVGTQFLLALGVGANP